MSFVNLISEVMARIVTNKAGIDKFLALIIIFLSAVECYSGYKAIKALRCIYGFLFGVIIGILTGSLMGMITKSIGLAAGVGVGSSLIFGVAAAILTYMFYTAGTIMFVYMVSSVFALVLFNNLGLINGLTLTVCFLFGCMAASGLFWRVRPAVIILTSISGAILVMNATCVLMGVIPTKYPGTSIGLCCILAVTGIMCQFFTTTKNLPNMLSLMNEKNGSPTLSFSERKYPGMQRAYRNYCIRCGHGLANGIESCPECGFIINE